ncbi:MAG TPA: efflux transporter outer membrane subunit [Magnetospirillaceae bacterium]|nr:efflux transporter outer membrane subunit [Magnetospirillaceae bacterium]
MKSLRRLTPVISLAALLAGCNFAPDYEKPKVAEAPAYKEDGDWKTAQPADAAPRGDWWTRFGDSRLNDLEQRLDASSPTLAQALAAHDQALAAAGIVEAAELPNVSYGAGAQRFQRSKDNALKTSPNLYNDFSGQLNFSWEIDLWGRVRNMVSAAQDRAQASDADLAGVKLSLESDLAADYLALQGLDALQDLLDRTVKDDEDALAYTTRRHDGGVAAQVDVDQAEAQLATSQTQDINNKLLRAQMEHAIAILVGEAPANFSMPPKVLEGAPPMVAAGLPSTLLERRPDVAAAERRVAAANADIGVARAGYFPVFDISSMIGLDSSRTNNLLFAPSKTWAFGASATGPLFDYGRTDSLVDQARAIFQQAVASYQQTVLGAYRDVEDNLVALHRLEEEAGTSDTAVNASKRALDQAETRYKGGIATYLEVITAQNVYLSAQSTSIDIRTRRMTASVRLIQALGGGWDGLPQTASN